MKIWKYTTIAIQGIFTQQRLDHFLDGDRKTGKVLGIINCDLTTHTLK